MPTIQELLTGLRQQTDIPATQLDAVVQAVMELETMLVAFFPPTKHYFITHEQDEPTAVIFSNRDSFERFAERCKEQGLYTAAIPNTKENRQVLFMDLVRCGFTRVLIDYAPAFLVLPVTKFYAPPDESALPLAQRMFLAPELTGGILWLFQQIHSGKAEGGQELDVLRVLYHAPLLMPAQTFDAGGKTAYNVPAHEQNGKQLAYLFTDRSEWERFGVSGELSPVIARFGELQKLLQNGFDRIVINPGNGAELVLDAQLLAVAEQAVMGGRQALELRTMQERGEKLTVSEPGEDAAELTAALTAVLEQQESVSAAYLRVLKRENLLHPSWLVLLDVKDDRSRQALHKALYTAAQPYLGSFDIEFADYASALELAGKAKPFYRKKRRLFQ